MGDTNTPSVSARTHGSSCGDVVGSHVKPSNPSEERVRAVCRRSVSRGSVRSWRRPRVSCARRGLRRLRRRSVASRRRYLRLAPNLLPENARPLRSRPLSAAAAQGCTPPRIRRLLCPGPSPASLSVRYPPTHPDATELRAPFARRPEGPRSRRDRDCRRCSRSHPPHPPRHLAASKPKAPASHEGVPTGAMPRYRMHTATPPLPPPPPPPPAPLPPLPARHACRGIGIPGSPPSWPGCPSPPASASSAGVDDVCRSHPFNRTPLVRHTRATLAPPPPPPLPAPPPQPPAPAPVPPKMVTLICHRRHHHPDPDGRSRPRTAPDLGIQPCPCRPMLPRPSRQQLPPDPARAVRTGIATVQAASPP